MNDDEWPDTFEPFLEQLEKYKKSKIPKDASLAFLKDWQSPVSEDNMEEFTEPGARDAEAFGKRLADRYKHLMPGGQDDPFRWVSQHCMQKTSLDISPVASSRRAQIATSTLPTLSYMACSQAERLATTPA